MSHGSHCCKKHGCKYGDDECPVVLGIIKQEYRQECCDISDILLTEAYMAILKDMKEKNIVVLLQSDVEKFIANGKKRQW